jgi:hypothetical protein
MRTDVFKYTSDDWYPSYILTNSHNKIKGLVKVSFTQTGPNPPIEGEWRVCVWGEDDCGMEQDFVNETIAWCCFLEVIGLEDVTMASLNSLGFISA